jgi:hypothetical protein
MVCFRYGSVNTMHKGEDEDRGGNSNYDTCISADRTDQNNKPDTVILDITINAAYLTK